MEISITNVGKAEQFAQLFQHIRLFTEHVNLSFEKDRMFMQSMDSARISVFELVLPSTWFDTYTLTADASITIGLNVSMLFKILNTRDKIQEIFLKLTTIESDTLFVDFTCNNKSVFDKRFELPLMDIDCEVMQIPETNSDADLSINSGVFSSLVNQLKLFGETLEIQCTEEKITMHSISHETGKMTVDIDIDDLTAYSITEGEIMKLSFGLTMLHNICMYSKLSTEIDICLTANFPMKIVYALGDNNAAFTFYLAPKINEDDN
jgi:proliferating cell nuclear antigen PCNA